MSQKYCLLALIIGAASVCAEAAPAADAPVVGTTSANQTHSVPVKLEEIVVTGTKLGTTLRDTPAAVTVITQDDVQLATQQLTLAESLGGVPGLLMQDRYNFALGLRVSLRGFGARANFGVRGVKILIDGIPETLPDGQASADSIDLGTVSRIEVIRGPSSTLYGNASGGVINITTEPPPAQPFAELRLSGGEFGFNKTQLKAGGQGEKVGYLLSVSDWSYDGFRDHSHAEKKNLTGRFNIELGNERELLATVSYGKQPISQDPGGVTAAFADADPTAARPANVTFDARQHYEQTRLGFVYKMPVGANDSLTAKNYYVWRDFMQFLPYESGGIPAFKRFFSGAGLSYNHNGFLLDRPNKLVVGLDLQNQDDDVKRYDNNFGAVGAKVGDQNETVISKGVYLQDELSITKKLLLTLGARYDEVTFDVSDHLLGDGDDSGKVTETSTSPMAALVYTLSPAVNIYWKYSTSFEVPTTSEYATPDSTGGFNQSLKPQLSTNYEMGMRGTLADINRYEVALYTVDTQDELIPFEVPGSPGHDYFVNAGSSTRNGIEMSLVSNVTDRIQTTFTYTYSDFTFDKFVTEDGDIYSGNVLPGTAKNQFYGEIRYEAPSGWFGSLNALYIGKQFTNNANSANSDPYTVANVRAGYRVETGAFDITPFVSVNNLFDESYYANVRINAFGGRFFEPAPGRNWFAGVTLKYHY